MSACVAAINAGSSSIKFALYEASTDLAIMFRGQIEGLGVAPRLRVKDAQDNIIVDQTWPAAGFDQDAATREVLSTGARLISGRRIVGIGHRVVHGGAKYGAPVRVDRDVLASLDQLTPLAPLHQPHNLRPIQTILDTAPDLPQVACFDTAFHHRQSDLARSFAIPRDLTAAGVRRYGFHGLSYEFIVSRLRELSPEVASSRLVIAHLGNGASLCAVQNGQSVASTMGFTAVDGLMMGTRCGALDPGVILYLMREHRMDQAAIEDLIYRKSGLLGVSGISSDMRVLQASSEPAACEAIDLFVYRIVREIGSMAAAAGGIDGIVFAGGIGENDAPIRAKVIEQCAWLGAALDPERNAASNPIISADTSRISAWVVPTDEERMIVRHTMALLQ